MLRSCAPAAAPMRPKSPSLESAAQPPNTGAERKLARSSGSCVKPPDAKITALPARTRTVPSGPVASTPTTAPPPPPPPPPLPGPLDAMRDADVHAVALGRRAQRADAYDAAVGHRVACPLRH